VKAIFQQNSLSIHSADSDSNAPPFLSVWLSDLEHHFTPRGAGSDSLGVTRRRELWRFTEGSSSTLRTLGGFRKRLERRLRDIRFLWEFGEKNGVPLLQRERSVQTRASAKSGVQQTGDTGLTLSARFSKVKKQLVGLQSLFAHDVLGMILKCVEWEAGKALIRHLI